jgi:hypothetical protein
VPDLRGGRLEVDLPAPAPPSLDPLDRRAWPWLVALALVVRVVLMWLLEPSPPIADENWYRGTALRPARARPVVAVDADVRGAVHVAAGGADGVRAGDGPVRRGRAHAPAGETWPRGALLVLPVHRLGVAFAGARVGRAAAVIVALYPDLLLHGVRLWTEPLYTLNPVARAQRARRGGHAPAVGVGRGWASRGGGADA